MRSSCAANARPISSVASVEALSDRVSSQSVQVWARRESSAAARCRASLRAGMPMETRSGEGTAQLGDDGVKVRQQRARRDPDLVAQAIDGHRRHGDDGARALQVDAAVQEGLKPVMRWSLRTASPLARLTMRLAAVCGRRASAATTSSTWT